MNVGALENVDAVVKPVGHKLVQIGGVDAEQLNYGMKFKLPSNTTVEAAVTQYLVVVGQDIYVITFGAPADSASEYAPLVDKMAQSVRFKQSR
jgi:hypothetical protein